MNTQLHSIFSQKAYPCLILSLNGIGAKTSKYIVLLEIMKRYRDVFCENCFWFNLNLNLYILNNNFEMHLPSCNIHELQCSIM